jgi:hypothetical protein
MGHGASAVARLITGEAYGLVGEEDVFRVMYEFGWPAGLAFMAFRWLLELAVIAVALQRTRDGNPLALLLVPLTFSSFVLGIMEQPTSQGFMVISVAFSLAALKRPSQANVSPRPMPTRTPRLPPGRLAARSGSRPLSQS